MKAKPAMAKLLMNLRHVPEDEADEVRALLGEHTIEFYETPPNRWGISMGGIWLRHEAQAEEAARLLQEYQARRQADARAAYEAGRRAGTADTLLARVRREPLRVLVYIAAAGIIVYLLVAPFFRLAPGL